MGKKFYPINKFPGYTINTFGDVKDPTDTLLKPYVTCGMLCYNINNVGYGVAKLIWETFIGEINTYIRYVDGNEFNVNIKNLYVDLNIIKLSTTKYIINDVVYTVIPGFSAYVISRQGTVYSLKRRQFVAKSFNHANYPTVALVNDNGFRSPKKVHRLVYLTYVGPLDEHMVIDHIDGNRLNSSVENLRQISNRENVCRAYPTNDYYIFKPVEEYEVKNPYTEEEIEKICQMLSENASNDKILSSLGYEYNDINYNTLVSVITKLRKRELYADITNKYNVPDKPLFGKNKKSFFSESDIKFIIDQFKKGRPQQSIAKLFNTKQATISYLLRRYYN